MAFARTCSVALVGVEGVVVEVQADLEPGVAAFTLVGLPDKSLTESKDRVRAAVVNSGAAWPQKKLSVGLSPASVPKSGSGFDLAVAAAVLGAAERIDPRVLADIVMIGELGLDGRVRAARARSVERLAGTPWCTNSEVPGRELRSRWYAEPGAMDEAERNLERGVLTARGLDRVLRVAWTVADLVGHDRPDATDVALALQLRTGVPRGVPMAIGART